MSNLLIHLKPQQGYNRIFELGQYDMKLTRFGLVQLKQGTSWSADTGDFEAALVLLGGKCSIEGKDFEFADNNTKVHLANLEGIKKTYMISELLPLAFNEEELKK